MRRKIGLICAVTLGFLNLAITPTLSQSFSCGIGDRGACLGYGDTVCSSAGKCVSSSSACFDSFQCNYEGFTCKSNVSRCVTDYNELLERHNSLVNDYNALRDQNRELIEENNDLVRKFNAQLDAFEALEKRHNENLIRIRDLADCVTYSSTVEDAQVCI